MIVPAQEPAQIDGAAPGGEVAAKGPLLRLIRDQRIAFLLVGVANTAIGTSWFILFLYLIRPLAGYMVVLLCAHIASVLCAFILYRYLVFRVRGHVLLDLLRFETVNLASLGMNAAMLPFLVEVFHWRVLFSQFAILGATMVVSFFGHRSFSFRRSAADHAKSLPASSQSQSDGAHAATSSTEGSAL